MNVVGGRARVYFLHQPVHARVVPVQLLPRVDVVLYPVAPRRTQPLLVEKHLRACEEIVDYKNSV